MKNKVTHLGKEIMREEKYKHTGNSEPVEIKFVDFKKMIDQIDSVIEKLNEPVYRKEILSAKQELKILKLHIRSHI
ncbi:hypothetical protein N9924_00200 [bacterium]|nr:hypothetical protein [bacterium]